MKKIAILIIILVVIYILFLLSGIKILIKENRVNPGDKYIVEDYGDLGESKQTSLACKYFNGRKIVTRVFWYSSNNIMGRDSCPVLLKD